MEEKGLTSWTRVITSHYKGGIFNTKTQSLDFSKFFGIIWVGLWVYDFNGVQKFDGKLFIRKYLTDNNNY